MEENCIGPWVIDPEITELSEREDREKRSQPFISQNFTPLKKFADSLGFHVLERQQVHKMAVPRVKSNIRIRAHSHQCKAYESSPVEAKQEKKMRSTLKIEVFKLQNDHLWVSQSMNLQKSTHPSGVLASSSNSSLRRQKSKECRTISFASRKQMKQKLFERSKMFNRMLREEEILLNEKMGNIFSANRPKTKIQINIDRHVSGSYQREFPKRGVVLEVKRERLNI